ncbi:YmfQ family protein [Geosporobacter ferrireducens]|uniref:YmfQ family protein n=1 Tax=Geosporobacter ferrireducens TaxID=1424294 RepID=UPI00139E523D|nr:YmfQ family protein [Geosporobacter ferrireducens]MTI56166.1 DUF2313 domain-containing protein [Geosporobacter ferrireducens]
MAYGEYQYGSVQYGAEPDIESVQPYMPNLMKYLPPYWHEIREMKEIQKTTGEEIGNSKYIVDNLLKQCFVQTATWGLTFWERELGLTTDSSKAYEHRREIIWAKLRGAGTTTKVMIKNVAMAFSGGEVEVQEYPAEYRFVVRFIGVKGIPANMPGLIQSLNEIKPAHLAYTFQYTFTVWNMLSNLTWNGAQQRTWNELKVWEG